MLVTEFEKLIQKALSLNASKEGAPQGSSSKLGSVIHPWLNLLGRFGQVLCKLQAVSQIGFSSHAKLIKSTYIKTTL